MWMQLNIYFMLACVLKDVFALSSGGINGSLWSFLVHKQSFCLHSVFLTKTHCVCSLSLTNECTSQTFANSFKYPALFTSIFTC